MPKIYLVNVGVNASHVLKSPRFSDSSFELVPIPEHAQTMREPMRRYADVPSRAGARGGLLPYLTPSHHERYCHHDPEFTTRTYGDDVERSPRAMSLKKAETGDWLLFLARLWDWNAGAFTGSSSFYFVAGLEVASILKSVQSAIADDVAADYGGNAHVLRALADSSLWNSFWVFKGSDRSHLFRRAVECTPELANELFRDKSGAPWTWLPGRSPLQTIGSYTRTVRVVADTKSEAFRAWPEALRNELR